MSRPHYVAKYLPTDVRRKVTFFLDFSNALPKIPTYLFEYPPTVMFIHRMPMDHLTFIFLFCMALKFYSPGLGRYHDNWTRFLFKTCRCSTISVINSTNGFKPGLLKAG